MSVILVVEDEAGLREALVYTLQRQGYQVEPAENGHLAVEVARRLHPDLILLDLMLPGIDGFEVCRILRQEMNIPILMVTARDEEMDRVVGLEIGADDYITKPFSMRELVARVKAHLRHDRLLRNELGGQAALPVPEVLQFDGLEIDLSRREVRLNQRVIALKPKEYELLLYLARHRRQVIGRETLLERVWGWEYSGNSRTVDVHVRWLREKIETEPASPTRIVTVRGSGYRFEG